MPTLTDGHREYLMGDSGLSVATIEAMGWYSVTASEASEIAGFTLISGGIAIPYPGCEWIRIRLDHPHLFEETKRLKGEGNKAVKETKIREARYVSPRGSRNCAFILPQVKAALNNPTTAIGITEGEKKAAKATQEGIPTIALPGVWSWLGRSTPHLVGDEVKETALLAQLTELQWRGRQVYLFWDSDAFENPNVLEAGRSLRAELRRRGANARLVAFESKGGKKVGLDDFLLDHTTQELLDYAQGVITAATERNFDILAIEKLLTEPPAYNVQLSWGMLVGGLLMDDLYNWHRFRKRVAAVANRLPVLQFKKGEDTWGLYLDDVLATVLYEEPVPEGAQMRDVWWDRIRSYLHDKAVEDPKELAGRRGPYRHGDKIYVNGSGLLTVLQARYGDIKPGELWDILRRHGAEGTVKAVRVEDGEQRISVRAWSVPEAALTEIEQVG